MQIIIGVILIILICAFLFKIVKKNFFPLLFLGALVWAAYRYTYYFFWSVGIGFVVLVVAAYFVQRSKKKKIRAECEHLLQGKNFESLNSKFVSFNSEERKLFVDIYHKELALRFKDGERVLEQLFLRDFLLFAENKIGKAGNSAIFEKHVGERYLKDTWGVIDGWGVDLAIKLLKNESVAITEALIRDKEKNPINLITIRFSEEDGGIDPLIACDEVIELD